MPPFMAPLRNAAPTCFPVPARYPSDLARSCASRTCFRLRPGSLERLSDARRHARLTGGHGALADVTVQPPVSPPRALRCQIRKEWPRLEVPVGLSDRSTVGHRPVPPRRVSTGPPPRGEPHQPYATTCQPSQQQGQPQSKPRLFYKIAPRFLVNQPAVLISSK